MDDGVGSDFWRRGSGIGDVIAFIVGGAAGEDECEIMSALILSRKGRVVTDSYSLCDMFAPVALLALSRPLLPNMNSDSL